MGGSHGEWRREDGRMTLQRQVGFWIGALLLLIFLLWLLSNILLPFIAGLVLAYFLDPLADALERAGLPRLAASLLILIMSILGFTVLLLLVLPALGDQIGNFARNFPSYVQALTKLFNQAAPAWLKTLLAQSETNAAGSVSDIAGRMAGW